MKITKLYAIEFQVIKGQAGCLVSYAPLSPVTFLTRIEAEQGLKRVKNSCAVAKIVIFKR